MMVSIGFAIVENISYLINTRNVLVQKITETMNGGIKLNPFTGQFDIAGTGGGGGGGTVTAVTASGPLASTGGTTPNITIQQSSTSLNGYLSSSNFTIFNNKVSSVSASGPLASSGGTTPNLTIQQSSVSLDGFLSASNFSVFSNKQNALTIGNLTDVGTDGIAITGGTGSVIGSGVSIAQQKSDASHSGYLSAADWTSFNNKLDASRFNYITNYNAEVDTSDWNLYNDAGRTDPAYVLNQDLTFTSALAGNAGNGVNVQYIYNASFPSSTPNINVVSSSIVQVRWNNGPTIANNPTATQLKAAWDAVPAALAIATVAITGTASNRQYMNGSNLLGNGGDTAPVDGSGGTVDPGVTFTRNTSTPLVGIASFDLGKDAVDHQGTGVSTDFTINALDKGQYLQINFAYQGSTAMTLGTSSDVRVFIYDVTNAQFISVTPLKTIAGPVNTAKTYVGKFLSSSTSVNYRLILHIATQSASAWDLLLDEVIVNDVLSAEAATQVPSVVLPLQAISGAVTDHMCVMWTDGATQWVPATIAGATIPSFGTDRPLLGFVTNIVGLTGDVYIHGQMDGFSFGPFVGYNQYIDNTAGSISPLPSPFTDRYCGVGKGISSTILDINFTPHVDIIANSSGTPLKGGLLSNSAVNDGTGDQVLTVGTNGNVLVANSAASLGLQWLPAVVAGTGLTYTTATRALTLSNLAGDVTGAPQTNTIAAATVTGKALTGFVSGAGTVTAADTILTAFNKINGNVALKQSSTLTNAHILVGNVSNLAVDVAVTGDVTISNTGVTAIGTNKVVNSMLAQMAAHTFKGNNTGSTANPIDLTANELSAELNSSIVNQSAVTGATVTAALNTLNNNVSQVIAQSYKNGGSATANTTIDTWTGSNIDTNSAFNLTSGVFTVPIAGNYRVNVNLNITAGTATLTVKVNGTAVGNGLITSNASTTIQIIVANAAVNDTITIELDQTKTLPSTNIDNRITISKEAGYSNAITQLRYNGATATITSSLSLVTYTNSDFNTHAGSYASGVYTVPTAGKYNIKASLSLTAATAAAGNNYDIIIRKNGTEVSRNKFVVGAATQKPNTVVIDDLVSCAANDTIDIQASAAGTTPSINASTTLNFLYINKLN